MSNVPVVSHFAYLIAKNWIAGKSMSEALEDAKEANSKGLKAIINYLGEEINDPAGVEKALQEYLRLIDSMQDNSVDGCISVKLTQIGLSIGKDYCAKNLAEIVRHAGERHVFVWIDMESSKFTDDTIDLYLEVLRQHSNVGLCIQCYLKRSMRDVEKLVEAGGKTRLVKGAYDEPATLAYKSKQEIDANYLQIMDYLFVRSNGFFALGTHDDKITSKALALNEKNPRDFEFEMLKGIRDKLKLELVKGGCRVSEYIPYGEAWFSYSLRRVREKPGNIFLLARSLISH